MLYLETKWALLIPYAKVAELLKDVLPVAETLNQETVRNNLHAVANRIERELGEEPTRFRGVGSGLGRAAVARWPDDRWN